MGAVGMTLAGNRELRPGIRILYFWYTVVR
jgi:hypothetical protein